MKQTLSGRNFKQLPEPRPATPRTQKRARNEVQPTKRVCSPLVKKEDHQGFRESFMKSKKQANKHKTFKTQRISPHSSKNSEVA